MNRQKILNIIYKAMEMANQSPDMFVPMTLAEDTVLFGPSSKLDSLGLVSLIVEIERIFREEYEVTIILADDRAMSQKKSPFRTVRTLADYIDTILKKEGDNKND